jgi:hypothetical protein
MKTQEVWLVLLFAVCGAVALASAAAPTAESHARGQLRSAYGRAAENPPARP